MTRTPRRLVLLARPHPLIVKEMRQFLTDNDYEPLPFAGLTTRPRDDPGAVMGGVISTSLTSAVRQPVAEVAHRLREWYPGLPLIIATLGERGVMARANARALHTAIGTVGVLDALKVNEDDERLGGEEYVLLLHRSDLLADAAPPSVAGVVRRHLVGTPGRIASRLDTVRQ